MTTLSESRASRRRFGCAALVAASCAFASVSSAQEPAAASYFPQAFDADVILYPGLTAAQRAQLIQDLQHTIQLNQESIAVFEDYERRTGVSREAAIGRARATIFEAARRIAALAAERRQQALKIARQGKVSDVPQLQADLTIVLAAARTNQLLGNPEGTAQQAAAIEVLRVFSEAFARTCRSQSFDYLQALGLGRQNELLGTGIDLSHCAYRLLEGSIIAPNEAIRWRHCGMGYGEWKMRTSGLNVGQGSGSIEDAGSGPYSLRWTNLGGIRADVAQKGQLRVRRIEDRNAAGHIVAAHFEMSMVSSTASGKIYPPPPFGPRPVHEAIQPDGPMPVSIINNNQPCDRDKDVWSY
jgi:hypothetical protein